MILLSILIPGLSFLLRGKILSAILAFVLQGIAIFTFMFFGIGALLWIILAVWAIVSYNNAKNEKRHRETIQALREERAR